MNRSFKRWGLHVAPLALFMAAAVLPLAGQGAPPAATGTKAGEWPTYGGDLASTRYSPLDQVNASNFDKLEIAWRFKTENLGPRPEFQFQSTPLMVKGMLYFTAGSRRAVVAVDAATGEMKWMHSIDEGPRAAASARQLSGRGLSYWTDGKEERVLYVTLGYQMVALDAKTGDPIPSFGKNGIVDLKLEIDQEMDPVTGEVALHSAPVVVKNIIIIGAAHREGGAPRSKTNQKGYVRGFDVRTRQAHLDFQDHPRARRVRQRNLGEGLVELHRQHRRLGADERGRGTGPGLHAGRAPHRRLLRRPSSREQPVQ